MNKWFIFAVILCFVLFHYRLSRYADDALVYIPGINIIYRNIFKESPKTLSEEQIWLWLFVALKPDFWVKVVCLLSSQVFMFQ